MPTYPSFYEGLGALAPLLQRAFGGDRYGDWRLLGTIANRMREAASELSRPADTECRSFRLDVLASKTAPSPR